MGAVVPFDTVEGCVGALAKVDVIHRLVANDPTLPPHTVPLSFDAHMVAGLDPASEYFLAPVEIRAYSEGDEMLWDGAGSFTQNGSLRFQVGDSVRCATGGDGLWVGGVVVRQPVQDGETAAYDVLLSTGERLEVATDDELAIVAGPPRPVASLQLVFGCVRVGKPHDEAIAAMSAFGADVQLVEQLSPPEVPGRVLHRLDDEMPGIDQLYERTVLAAAALLNAEVRGDWRRQRSALVQENTMPKAVQRPRGRPPRDGRPQGPLTFDYYCPVAGCSKALGGGGGGFMSHSGLYVHKKAYHPELITSVRSDRPDRAAVRRDRPMATNKRRLDDGSSSSVDYGPDATLGVESVLDQDPEAGFIGGPEPDIEPSGPSQLLSAVVAAEEAAATITMLPLHDAVAADEALRVAQSDGHSAAAEEALRIAQAEGLTLLRADTFSGYRGVVQSRSATKSWKAQVWRGGKEVALGTFYTKEEAALCVARSPEAMADRARKPMTAEDAERQAAGEGLTLARSDGQSGYRGVKLYARCKNKPYMAKLHRQGKLLHLGYFATPEEAALHVARAESQTAPGPKRPNLGPAAAGPSSAVVPPTSLVPMFHPVDQPPPIPLLPPMFHPVDQLGVPPVVMPPNAMADGLALQPPLLPVPQGALLPAPPMLPSAGLPVTATPLAPPLAPPLAAPLPGAAPMLAPVYYPM